MRQNLIFLDIDGVLNCEIFYLERGQKKGIELPLDNICRKRVEWLNGLCERTSSKVIISYTWRHSGIEYCRKILKEAGATFEIIDITPDLRGNGYVRGNEIYLWLQKNIRPETYGCRYYEFFNYVIIDDESDMLLWQAEHLFKTDAYSGLTPNICYKIEEFFKKFNP